MNVLLGLEMLFKMLIKNSRKLQIIAVGVKT